MKKVLVIDGNALRIADIQALVTDQAATVEIAPKALKKIRDVRQFLVANLDNQIIYGINTGFGPMASHIIGKSQLLELQNNLVRSHAVGMGEPIPPRYLLAAMIIRLNALAKGYSGVTPELISHLQTFINKRIIPVVPTHGAVGTSGDLVQLAHIALALIGEGQVLYDGACRNVGDVLQELHLKPYALQPKEGLALINGTSVMTGIASILCAEAEHLLSLATYTGGLALEMVNGFRDSLSETIHDLRPHPGQKRIAARLRAILASSKLLQERERFNHDHHREELSQKVHQIPKDVQDVYSLRCIPQILGPITDSIQTLREIVEVEINSVTDNPIVDASHSQFLHGGNFHGDYIAYAVDQLKMTLVKLTMLSERRINYFLNHRANRRFSPFLNLNTPGLTLALQGLQFVATSTTANSQTLAFPQYVHSIPTNADNQDLVSMGTDAALIAARVLDNAFIVLTIEIITLAQAVDCLDNRAQLSEGTRRLFDGARALFPAITNDRNLIEDLRRLQHYVRYETEWVVSP